MHTSFDTVIKQISTQDNQKCSFDKKLKLPHQWKFKFGAVPGSKQNQMVNSAAGAHWAGTITLQLRVYWYKISYLWQKSFYNY